MNAIINNVSISSRSKVIQLADTRASSGSLCQNYKMLSSVFGRLPRSLASPEMSSEVHGDTSRNTWTPWRAPDRATTTATRRRRHELHMRRRKQCALHDNPVQQPRSLTYTHTHTHAYSVRPRALINRLLTCLERLGRRLYKQSAEKRRHHSVTDHQQLIPKELLDHSVWRLLW